MLKKYKNAFLDAIHEVGLDPSMFDTEEGKDDGQDPIYGSSKVGQPIFIIKLNNSPIKFVVAEVNTSFHTFSYRGTFFAPTFILDFWRENADASKVLAAFKEWLEEVAKKYIEDNDLPDYWSQLKVYGSLVVNSDFADEKGTEFTEQEKETVRRSIDKFHQLVNETFTPSAQQAEYINDRLDYLTKAVDRLNRFDWNAVAINIVTSITVNLSVDTEKGRLLYALLKTAFHATTKLLQ